MRRTLPAAVFSALLLVTLSASRVNADPPLAGLQFWLDGQDLNADGVPDGLAIGSAVSLWKDKAGNLELSQSAAGNRPVVSSLAGSQAVLFADSGGAFGDVLADKNAARLASAPFLANGAGTVVIVHELATLQGPDSEGMILAAYSGPGTKSLNFEVLDAGVLGSAGAVLIQQQAQGNGLTEGGPGVLGTGPHWTAISSNGSDNYSWTSDGVGNRPEDFLCCTPGDPNAPDASAQGFWFDDAPAPYLALSIGAQTYAEPNGIDGYVGLNGKIAEILIYDHVLDGSEMFALGTYLNGKYGLQVPEPTSAGIMLICLIGAGFGRRARGGAAAR